MTNTVVSYASCWESSMCWRNIMKVCEKLTTKSPIKAEFKNQNPSLVTYKGDFYLLELGLIKS